MPRVCRLSPFNNVETRISGGTIMDLPTYRGYKVSGEAEMGSAGEQPIEE